VVRLAEGLDDTVGAGIVGREHLVQAESPDSDPANPERAMRSMRFRRFRRFQAVDSAGVTVVHT